MNDVHNIVREDGGGKIKRGKQNYRFVVINKIGNINNKERTDNNIFQITNAKPRRALFCCKIIGRNVKLWKIFFPELY